MWLLKALLLYRYILLKSSCHNYIMNEYKYKKYDVIFIIIWTGMMFPFNFQLRYLQTLSSIAAEHNSTIIFPMPMNILDHFMGKKSKDQELDALEDTFWALKSIQTHNNDIYMNKYKYNQIYLWRLY